MDPSQKDGPDDSSIKPVSSLRARFENMNKGNDVPQAPPRTVSPTTVSKPKPLAQEPPPLPPNRPEPKNRAAHPAASGLKVSSTVTPAPKPANRFPASPLTPQPVKPPSVLVQPPLSPPKNKAMGPIVGEHTGFLIPDSVAATPVSPSQSSRGFKIPSRPCTPSSEARRSPKPQGSRPPSPPPPRRSGEHRRPGETKQAPPPVNRADKPNFANRISFLLESQQSRTSERDQADKHSPFSSPPGSASSTDSEAPPSLPTRPRPKPADVPSRTQSIHGSFNPPPVHPSVANRRKEQEVNGHGRGQGALQVPSEKRPALPARPLALEPPQSNRPSGPNSPLLPPPRPPRPPPAQSRTAITVDTSVPASSPPKRVVSTPTSQQQLQQHPPPPVRTHGRSMTLDRTSERVPPEFRVPPPNPPHVSSRDTGVVDIPKPSFPDMSAVNRRAPYLKSGAQEIHTKYETRVIDVCVPYVCTTGFFTRVWSLLDGELLMSLSHGEGVKATAVKFKPGGDLRDEGAKIWIGTNIGELLEADLASQNIVRANQSAHGRREVIKIYRHYNELWTLDEGGSLNLWGPDSSGVPNLANNPHMTYRMAREHTFSMVVGDELWYATGKDVRIVLPTLDGRSQFQLFDRPFIQDAAGEICSGTTLKSHTNKVFFGHVDGKVSIYSRKDYTCLALLSISPYKIHSLAGVGDYLWAAYGSGKICIYDIDPTPWAVKKEWQAHHDPVVKLVADPSSFYASEQCQVVSLGADSKIHTWDGLLQDDWLEEKMKMLEHKYCQFEELKVLVMTWNAGASTPNSLNHDAADARFIPDLLRDSGAPDILVFGFQELVDLEDKSATAKRLFKSKKKETDQERMSHQYRDWRDFLMKNLDDYMPSDALYHLLHSAPLVGLFTCIFVKSTIRDRITNLSAAEVKRGMGGYHGNKGAIIIRFMVNDSSLCFINCHLAAGQSQANSRHADLEAILESTKLPQERNPDVRIDSYVSGGDGTMIMDHELCLLNGDLNYRIDTMSRDTVVIAVKQNNLSKLLERDQLLVARRRNAGFKLRAFEEMPITFAPTYKYDVGTDNYDTSEKKRSPAWCDRLLYRGKGKIQQLDYKRHEVRVSDHRPVSGRFSFKVKTVSPRERVVTWSECQQQFEDIKSKEAREEKVFYLTQVIGYDKDTANQIIGERESRRMHRSPSRHRE